MSGAASGSVAAVPVGLSAAYFVLAAVGALLASTVLVVRLERIGARVGLSETALGLVAALAANAPEITSAVTALLRGQHQVGAGVVLGSNVFNLAALLGLGALVAGRIALHRRVVVLLGSVAGWLALVALGTAGAVSAPGLGLGLALAVFVPVVVLSASRRARAALPVGRAATAWLEKAVSEEEAELAGAVETRPATTGDALLSVVALAVVLGASVVMEHAATAVGEHLELSGIVTGGVVLAAVTSLPNAVAAVYLARRGRAVAVLSEALNSNNLNVLVGLLLPATILGLGPRNGPTVVTAAFGLAMTAGGLAMAYAGRGLRRLEGVVLVVGYLAFLAVVVSSA